MLKLFCRRLFYLLSALSTLGAWDIYISLLQNSSKVLFDSKKIVNRISREALLAAICQSIVFVVTLIMSITESLFTDRFGEFDDLTVLSDDISWVERTLKNNTSISMLQQFDNLGYIRLAFSLFGWFL